MPAFTDSLEGMGSPDLETFGEGICASNDASKETPTAGAGILASSRSSAKPLEIARALP